MKKASYIARSAGSALAIAVVVASSPTVAQDAADPVPVVVATMPANQTEPTAPAIVVPEVVSVQPPTVSQAPTVEATSSPQAEASRSPAQAAPDTAAWDSAGIPRVSTRSSVTASNNVSPPDDVPSISGSVAAPIVATPASGDAASDFRAMPTASDAQAPVAEADDNDASLVMGGGALALALGLASLFMAGARRRRRQTANGGDWAAPAPVKPATAVADRVEPVAAAPLAPAGTFSLSHTVSRPFGVSKWDDPIYVNASGVAVSGRSVPDTPAGRKALIDRLVRANPDRTNPFRSSSARRRRARLIVQSLRQTMAQQPNLDFRRFYESFGRRKASVA